MKSSPFSRARAFFAALQAIASMSPLQQVIEKSRLGTYVSRGKGEGRANRSAPGAHKAAVRAAAKARNVKINKQQRGR